MIACLEESPAEGPVLSVEYTTRTAVTAWRDHGDEAAAQHIVDHLTPVVRGVAARSLPRPWMVDDAVQNSLANVFRSLDHFDARIPLHAWAACLAKNVCANILRSWRRRSVFGSTDIGIECLQDIEHSEERPSLDEAIMAREELRQVFRHIALLDDGDRTFIALALFTNCSTIEIAEATGMSLGAVRVRTSRMRSRLRGSLPERESSAIRRASAA